MDQPSTSSFNTWESNSDMNLPFLNLSVGKKISIDDENVEEDELEEVEVDENERLHLQKVSSLVEAAYQRVENFNKKNIYVSSAAVSENSSCGSTLIRAASLPDSLDGGKAEVEELKSFPVSFESALRTNQALQRRLTATLTRLQKTLQENILRQEQLQEEAEEQGLLKSQDKDYKESRNKYFARPSSFAVPYFKDRTGMPAPMNADAKYKVDHGYLDLYSTRLRTWLTSEQNSLVREVQREWKEHLVNDWKDSLRGAERKLKNQSISEERRKEIEEEIQSCQNHVNFFTNVPAEKIDMPRGSKIDWDKVSAKAFDGCRSTEECQLLWENYMHPNINKDPWSEDEDIEIQETILQSSEEEQEWEELASKLGTGRTGFQVLQRWVSFIKPTIKPARWTVEGSKKLEDTINMLRVGAHIPWAQVAQHLTGYTKSQLQSRWRNINPDQSKGPFTSDEDFVIIKGLYKFGMNFDLIAHFLPGRSRVQVRERFKRAILPGLTTKPWTWREDKKIINNCSLESQHWRRMGMLMPKRDTCQIRLRFYILHFWQSISADNKLPPPVFPLSMTSKPAEVKELRAKILKLNPDVKIYLNSIQPEEEDKKSLELFADGRDAVCRRRNPTALARFLTDKDVSPKGSGLVRRRRRRGRPGPRTQSWPDKALTEFFLPGRARASREVDFDRGDYENLRNHLHRMGQALQLKVTKAVTEAELCRVQEVCDMQEGDSRIVNDVFVEHHARRDYGEECLACHAQDPDIIPLIPPNITTTGAFRSLLLHKPKLEEMASKEFLLYQVPRSQLHKLGTKPKTLKEEPVVQKFEISEEQINTFNEETETRKANQSTENGSDDGATDCGESANPRRKRKAAAIANVVNYVYSQEELKPNLFKEPVIRKEVLEPPSETELEKMQLEGETSCFRESVSNLPREETIKKEDNLLFHRMLSLFFWPALFTLDKPPKESVDLSAQLAEDARIEQDLPDAIFDPMDQLKGKGKLPHISIEEQAHMILKMEAVKTQKRRRFTQVYVKPNVELTPEDMKQRIYMKNINKLKRSLIMKKAWERRRMGVPPMKVVKKEPLPCTRPKSTRRAALNALRVRQREEEEQRERRLLEQQQEESVDMGLML